MKLYRTTSGIVVDMEPGFARLEDDWDDLYNRANLAAYLRRASQGAVIAEQPFDSGRGDLLPPLVGQEVWAAGVTYFRSRDARMEESREAGGGDFYARVYDAERPELFFKATLHRVSGPWQPVRIRSDSNWNVPEPELALAINAAGEIIGYTICNDMSSRDIEGQNPLYLPQAKTYDGCCAVGPCILVSRDPPPASSEISMTITRAGSTVFEGATTVAQLKRTPRELVDWLYRENSFPRGCILSTGTGIVPPDDFTLRSGDRVRMSIEGIGTLENTVL
jgi:2-dehydro-3-deoxy-D-arabinonate dehydratase